MNILIIEDHPLIRMGLGHLIFDTDPKANVTQSDSFPAGLSLLGNEKFDLLILDIDIPGGENIRMMEMVRQRQPDILILIHSGYDEQVYALPYMQAGADGFLSKQASHDEFQAAYKALMNRGKYVSYRIQQTLLNNLGDNNSKGLKNPIMTLSPREMLVMQLLTEGKWTKEIASILKVKENTISTYKRRIFDKLDVSDEIELSKKVSLLKNF
ncbi:response regulator transcription factor [Dyadobacter frigoris]|uniref:Response regulator transcription factor n=1 Tax=Dyadobacter frigoris TaxID=2576211 RepID=A0A4U6D785_9BACT|nr:response regulator transcription factor [Dyadobacter frigoris]TKT93232.1 response regulator transcription factor [Dyadobacter frigoris]GLU54862.1 DNA-binding response regulator [Dyadobacter frigoris]